MPILTLDLKLPSEFVKTATAGTANDWLIIEKSGEGEVSKIAATAAAVGAMATTHVANGITALGGTSQALGTVSNGSGTAVALSNHVHPMPSAADVGAAPDGGSLATDWLCDDLRSASGYLYEQASGGSVTGSIDLYNTGVSNRMVFRNAAGFQFYELSGTTMGNVYVGQLTTQAILPQADSTYTIGVTGNRYYRGWFDEVYTGPLQSGTILSIEHITYNLGSLGNAWNTVFYQTATGVSDKREKTDIADGDLGLDFIDALRSVKFRWRVGGHVDTGEKGADGRPILTPRPGVRFHYGLVADEVKAALGEKDFGGYVEDAESGRKGLRYSQIVSVMIKAVQELHGQVKELSTRLEAAEARLAAPAPATRSRA